MSSHREAPAISKDPVADNTDTYAFVTPNDTVTIITNYLPVEDPAGGPNFYEFGDDVPYQINIDNNGDGRPERDLPVPVRDDHHQPEHVPVQHRADRPRSTAPTGTAARPTRSPRITRRGGAGRSPAGLPCPPCNIGPRSTPELRGAGRRGGHRPRRRRAGVRRPAGRRLLRRPRLDLRPGDAAAVPVAAPDPDGRRRRRRLARPGQRAHHRHRGADRAPHPRGRRPHRPDGRRGRRSASGAPPTGRRARLRGREAGHRTSGPWAQVSRLGNPLFNEVIVPMAQKDRWNAVGPDRDREFARFVAQPELARLLPVLYPGVFPNLAALDRRPGRPAGDPAHRHPRRASSPGSRTSPGPPRPTMLRLNVAIPPSANPNRLGLLGGDLAGFPNGRRRRRRRGHHRAAGGGRRHLPAGRPDLHARRRRQRRSRTARSTTPAATSSTSSRTSACRTAGYDVPAAAAS